MTNKITEKNLESAAFWAGQALLEATYIRECLDTANVTGAEALSAEYAIALGYVPAGAKPQIRLQANLVI